eukprot:11503947-Alexandrium_andersonii.AAC.1
MRTGSQNGDASRQLARKLILWASSAAEVLKRTCLRCTNELGSGANELRQHEVPQGRAASGVGRAAEAA